MIGNLIGGRYRVIRQLGQGEFGATYLAEDVCCSNDLRIVKQFELNNDDPQVYRKQTELFKREAKAILKLSKNPKFKRVYAYFQAEGSFYLIEEYIEGKTLDQILAEHGTLSEKQVINILNELLDALCFVHKQEVIHQYVKPENIILRASGDLPILIDFGEIQQFSDHIDYVNNILGSSLAGSMSASYYLSVPEKDIYALGKTAICLLTGKSPKISWQEEAQQVSPELVNILNRATSLNPDERFTSVQGMMNALKAIANSNQTKDSDKSNKIWQKGNRMIVFSSGCAFLGGMIAQLPGVIIGGILGAVYGSIIQIKTDTPS